MYQETKSVCHPVYSKKTHMLSANFVRFVQYYDNFLKLNGAGLFRIPMLSCARQLSHHPSRPLVWALVKTYFQGQTKITDFVV